MKQNSGATGHFCLKHLMMKESLTSSIDLTSPIIILKIGHFISSYFVHKVVTLNPVISFLLNIPMTYCFQTPRSSSVNLISFLIAPHLAAHTIGNYHRVCQNAKEAAPTFKELTSNLEKIKYKNVRRCLQHRTIQKKN